MANNRFVGTIDGKSELNVTKTKERAVLNFTVAKARTLVGDIKENIQARIVLFGEIAEKANSEIDPGKVVLFSDVKRNPRMYTTDAGTPVETVDLVARSYKILAKKDFLAAEAELEKLCINLDELEFTEADRKSLAKAEEALEASVA